MTHVANLMKERVQTSDMIVKATEKMGLLMAEQLEDKHGWNGEKRREQAKEFPRREHDYSKEF